MTTEHYFKIAQGIIGLALLFAGWIYACSPESGEREN
jgi:hypothetical protein